MFTFKNLDFPVYSDQKFGNDNYMNVKKTMEMLVTATGKKIQVSLCTFVDYLVISLIWSRCIYKNNKINKC